MVSGDLFEPWSQQWQVGNYAVFNFIYCTDNWTSLVFSIGKELFSDNRIHLFMHHIPVYFCLDLMISYYFHKKSYIDKLGVFHASQISMCLDPHLN